MSSGELVAFLQDAEVGRLRRDRNGRLSFRYEERWRGSPAAYPVSLSMPLSLDEDRLEGKVRTMAGAVPDLAADVLRRARTEGLEARTLGPLVKALSDRARRCVV